MTHRHTPDLKKLKNERRLCQRELQRVEEAIQRLEGSRRSSRTHRLGKQTGNSATLADAIERVLAEASSPVPVAQIVERVQAAGYRSNSPQFRNLVNLTLAEDQRFRSSGRGRYALDGVHDEVGSRR